MADSPATPTPWVRSSRRMRRAVRRDPRRAVALAARDESSCTRCGWRSVACARRCAPSRGVYEADAAQTSRRSCAGRACCSATCATCRCSPSDSPSDCGSSPATNRAIAEEIERDRTEAWHEVDGGLSSVRARRCSRRSSGGGTIRRSTARRTPRRAGKKPVAKADARWRARLERAHAASPRYADAGELLHDARKAAKRHRYAVELAEPVLGPEGGARRSSSEQGPAGCARCAPGRRRRPRLPQADGAVDRHRRPRVRRHWRELVARTRRAPRMWRCVERGGAHPRLKTAATGRARARRPGRGRPARRAARRRARVRCRRRRRGSRPNPRS